VKKYNDHIVIQLNAPGRHLDDFTVKFDHEKLDLIITAQSIESSHEEDYLRHEFYLRGFVKTFYFGFDCQDSQIETKYLNGILYIKVMVGNEIDKF
jgi:HSP20 family molecular chaperone IbpA